MVFHKVEIQDHLILDMLLLQGISPDGWKMAGMLWNYSHIFLLIWDMQNYHLPFTIYIFSLRNSGSHQKLTGRDFKRYMGRGSQRLRINTKDPSLISFIGDFLNIYLPSIRNRDQDTIDSYKSTINLYLLYLQTAFDITLMTVQSGDFNQKILFPSCHGLKINVAMRLRL